MNLDGFDGLRRRNKSQSRLDRLNQPVSKHFIFFWQSPCEKKNVKSESLFSCPNPTDNRETVVRKKQKARKREKNDQRTWIMIHDPSNAKSNQCPPLTNPSPTPFRGAYHRRPHSEVHFRLPEDLF